MLRHADDKLRTLRRLPLFSGLPRRTLARLTSLVDEVTVPAGRVLVRPGSTPREFFVLLDGEVAIERRDGSGAVLGPGEFFGALSLVTGGQRSATAVATRRSRLFVMDAPAFRRVLRECPTVELRVLRTAVERLAGAAAA